MISKAKVRFLDALKKKKFRQKYNIFLAEGDKIVSEVLESPTINIHSIYATSNWLDSKKHILRQKNMDITEIDERELKAISSLKTPNQVVAALELSAEKPVRQIVGRSLNIVLENIRDPGNLGTIMRIADWFGLPYVFTSPESVDPWNPKVIQASMGAFLRVRCIETNLTELFREFPELPVYGTFADGKDLFQSQVERKGFLLIGNESKGISKDLAPFIHERIAIPGRGGAESLNAAIATAIITAVILNRGKGFSS